MTKGRRLRTQRERDLVHAGHEDAIKSALALVKDNSLEKGRGVRDYRVMLVLYFQEQLQQVRWCEGGCATETRVARRVRSRK